MFKKLTIALSLVAVMISSCVSTAPALANTFKWHIALNQLQFTNICKVELPNGSVINANEVTEVTIEGSVVKIETATIGFFLAFKSFKHAAKFVEFLIYRPDCI